ncbi:HNH endonuclease [Aeromonas veronii]
MLTCIYCESEQFESSKGSEEHVILSSLGGKKSSKNICCQTCNNKYGDEIDEELSKELSFFSTMLGITTGRNKPAPTQNRIVSHLGKDYDIMSGGTFKLSKANVQITDLDDLNGHEISITAGDEKQALNLLNKLLGKFDKSIDDFQSLEAKSVRSYVPTIHQRISLGGDIQYRSIVKMLLTYAATLISPERLRGGCFSAVIEYIKGNNPTYDGVKFDSVTVFPDEPNLDKVNHRIFFIASKNLKLAIGLIEIYGKLRFSAILSEQWDGVSIGKAYAIDPVSGRQDNVEINVTDEFFASLNKRDLDIDAYKKAIGQLIEVFQKRQTDEVIAKISENAIARHMVGKGEYVTREMIEQFSQEVAWEFVRFMHRLEDSEDIDLKKPK